MLRSRCPEILFRRSFILTDCVMNAATVIPSAHMKELLIKKNSHFTIRWRISAREIMKELVFTHDGSAFTIRLRKKKRVFDTVTNRVETIETDEMSVFSVSRIEAAEFNGISTDLCNLIATIYQNYKYLILC